MGIEYYFIKPDIKEIFCLGKHFEPFPRIANARCGKEPTLMPYTYKEFSQLMFPYLQDTDLTYVEINEVTKRIYCWCISPYPMYFDDDCREDGAEWLYWKEAGSISQVIEDVRNDHLTLISPTYYLDNFNMACELFDGDENKARILLDLLNNKYTLHDTSTEFDGVKMTLSEPERNCKYCTEEDECLFYFPDSVYQCYGKCHFYKDSNE